MKGYAARKAVAIALLAMLSLSACGSAGDDVRNHIADKYELASKSGSYATYRSDDSVERIWAAITSVARPGRDHQDSTGRYLGYENVMVHIEQEALGSGSEIEVTDAKDGYNRWGPTIIPIWGTYGGSYRGAFSGGGPGSGGK